MTRRQRDKYTTWVNEKPLTDIYVALEMLRPTQQGRTMTKPYLSVSQYQPELHRSWYHEADSGGDTSGTDYYEIDPEVSKELIKKNWVAPAVKKYFGGSTVERYKLVLSNGGRIDLDKYIEEQREIARAMLIPGEHSKYSGIFNNDGYDWENLYSGNGILQFDFKTPMNERVTVWPASKKIKKGKRAA